MNLRDISNFIKKQKLPIEMFDNFTFRDKNKINIIVLK